VTFYRGLSNEDYLQVHRSANNGKIAGTKRIQLTSQWVNVWCSNDTVMRSIPEISGGNQKGLATECWQFERGYSKMLENRKRIQLGNSRNSPQTRYTSAELEWLGISRKIDWLGFNGTFSTIKLYHAFFSWKELSHHWVQRKEVALLCGPSLSLTFSLNAIPDTPSVHKCRTVPSLTICVNVETNDSVDKMQHFW